MPTLGLIARVGVDVGAVEDLVETGELCTEELDLILDAELVIGTELDDLELVAAEVSLYSSNLC